MSHTSDNTSWAISAKGNHWRRQNGVVLVVGQFKANSDYWAMRDGNFIKGRFCSMEDAQYAAENNIEGDDQYSSDEGGW
jgi:hypothetical protein